MTNPPSHPRRNAEFSTAEQSALASNATFQCHFIKGFFVRLRRTPSAPIEFPGTSLQRSLKSGELLRVSSITTVESTDETGFPDFVVMLEAVDVPGQPSVQFTKDYLQKYEAPVRGGDDLYHGGMYGGRKMVYAMAAPFIGADDEVVHQAQGGSKSRAIIDASALFLPGQFHVAFTRVKTLRGLFIHAVPRWATVDRRTRELVFDWPTIQQDVRVDARAIVFWHHIGELDVDRYGDVLEHAQKSAKLDEQMRGLAASRRHHGQTTRPGAPGPSR